MTTIQRCRAAGVSSNIWARQCTNPAKTTRQLDGANGPNYPVCGVHANARYVYVYRPSPTSRREPPVVEVIER